MTTKVKNQRSQSLNTPCEVRGAYFYLHTKRTHDAKKQEYRKKDGTLNPRYAFTLMMPKLGATPAECGNYMFLYGLACEAARKMWPTSVDGAGQWVWPEGAKLAIHDGDVPFKATIKPGEAPLSPAERAEKNKWRNGFWTMEVENYFDSVGVAKVKNGAVVELPAQTINGVQEYKSGDWGIANIHAYAYHNETYGVNFGFDGFLFTREGEAIGNQGGPRKASDMFGGLGFKVGAPAPAAGGSPGVPPPVPGAGVMPPAPGPATGPTPPVAPVLPAPAPATGGLPPLPPPR